MNFADALSRLEPTAEITALGTVRGLDTTLVPARRYQLESSSRRCHCHAHLTGPCYRHPAGCATRYEQPTRCSTRVRAEIVVGFGGYVAAPAYLAARRRGLPLVVLARYVLTAVAERRRLASRGPLPDLPGSRAAKYSSRGRAAIALIVIGQGTVAWRVGGG
jgi:UDP-N-acetylglucosamine--N-acetylmuramyl-(pentapeptide) pyrophosphoryl-undecaprenol N-acetylglucosamine transferase